VNLSIDGSCVPGAIVSAGKTLHPGMADKYNQLIL
jgi:hypothetical protein